MPAYVIAQMTVNDVDMYYDYASKIGPTVAPYGGKILAANDAEVREGSLPYLRTDRRRVPAIWTRRAPGTNPTPTRRSSACGRTPPTGALFFVSGLTMPPREKSGE